MISTVLQAPVLAGAIMKFYQLFAGLLAWSVLAVLFMAVAKPLEALAAVVGFLGIPWMGAIHDVEGWLQDRSDVLAGSVAIVGIASLAWSFLWLRNRLVLFDRARGPATAWLCIAVITQLHGRQCLLGVIIGVLGVWALLLLTDVVGKRFTESSFGCTEPLSKTMLFLVAGGVLVMAWPALFALNALGGITSTQTKEQTPSTDAN